MHPRLILPAAWLAVATWLSACNLPGRPPATAEPGPATAAAQTVQAVLTQSGPGIQQTGRALQTPARLGSPTPSSTPAVSPTAGTAVAGCQNKASFIDDVTIRDNAKIEAGSSFVKIWRLRNSGECTWTPAYLLTFFGGQRMGAPSTVTLSGQVNPGETVDLAVDMEAPAQSGTYQGFWKLRDPQGQFFGIGPQGDQSFWVKIVVPAPATAAVTATPSPTSTSSSTPTPTTSVTPPTSTPSPSSTPTPTASPTGDATATPEDTGTPTG